MRLTEHEMTAAVQGAAKQALAVQAAALGAEDFDTDAAFEGMDRFARYQRLTAFGEIVLPVLVALPDVDVAPGTRPEFTKEQVLAAVDSCLDAAVAAEKMPPLSDQERVMARATHFGVVGWALAALPTRLDPDALLSEDDLDFTVPDTLEGL